jgi:serine protease inhibitor
MCYFGAGLNSSTSVQLKNLLNLNLLNETQIAKLSTQYMSNINDLNEHGDDIFINSANLLFTPISSLESPQTSHNHKYERVLMRIFGAQSQPLDLSNANKSAKAINTLVGQKTANKIINFISPSFLQSPPISLVLVNALYFAGSWTQHFDNALTRQGTFHLANGTSLSVDMMRLEGGYFTLMTRPSGLRASTCEMLYDGNDLAMTIVLPDVNVTLSEIEARLTPKILSEIIENKSSTKNYTNLTVYLIFVDFF